MCWVFGSRKASEQEQESAISSRNSTEGRLHSPYHPRTRRHLAGLNGRTMPKPEDASLPWWVRSVGFGDVLAWSLLR